MTQDESSKKNQTEHFQKKRTTKIESSSSAVSRREMLRACLPGLGQWAVGLIREAKTEIAEKIDVLKSGH